MEDTVLEELLAIFSQRERSVNVTIKGMLSVGEGGVLEELLPSWRAVVLRTVTIWGR